MGAAAVDFVDKRLSGASSGLINGFQYLGSGLSAVTCGGLIDSVGYRGLWLALAMGPLLLFATALGTRLNATAAYCITVGLAIYGLFGIAYLDFFLSQSGNPFFDLIFVVSPHYHLADLTDRLVFKMGALDFVAFATTSAYLAGLGCIVATASYFIYRDRK